MSETLLAGYGAIVATVVGLVQIFQWQASRRFVVVDWWVGVDEKDDARIYISIKNRAQFPVHLDYVAAGYYCRRRMKPWVIECDNVQSMHGIRNHRCTDEELFGTIDQTNLQPGEMIYAAIEAADIVEKNNIGIRPQGWLARPCIWIEHSQSNKPFTRKIKLSRPHRE